MRVGVTIFMILFLLAAGGLTTWSVMKSKVDQLTSLSERQGLLLDRGAEEVAGLKRITDSLEAVIDIRDDMIIQTGRQLDKCKTDLLACKKPGNNRSISRPVNVSPVNNDCDFYRKQAEDLQNELMAIRGLLATYANSSLPPEPDQPEIVQVYENIPQFPTIEEVILEKETIRYPSDFGLAIGPWYSFNGNVLDASAGVWGKMGSFHVGADYYFRAKAVGVRFGWSLRRK